MIHKMLEHSEMRRILILLGGAGICALVGAGIYVAAMHAVTPSITTPAAQGFEGASTRGS